MSNEIEKAKGLKDNEVGQSDVHPVVMAHGHPEHYANCASCGWTGEESELPPDPEGHECGKDECPDCGSEGDITCCYLSYEGAEEQDETDVDGYEAEP